MLKINLWTTISGAQIIRVLLSALIPNLYVTCVKALAFQAPNKGPFETQYKRQSLLFEIWLNKLHLGKLLPNLQNRCYIYKVSRGHIVGAPLIEEFSSLIRARFTVFRGKLSFLETKNGQFSSIFSYASSSTPHPRLYVSK